MLEAKMASTSSPGGDPTGAERLPGVIRCYKDLRVWREAMQLVAHCYRLTDNFPPGEEFGLKSQMRRAAVSIPSNIAEGHARMYTREYRHALSIALGSLAELETQVELSVMFGLISGEGEKTLRSGCDIVGKMLHGLKASLANHGFS